MQVKKSVAHHNKPKGAIQMTKAERILTIRALNA
jgi:hypothetical protein